MSLSVLMATARTNARKGALHEEATSMRAGFYHDALPGANNHPADRARAVRSRSGVGDIAGGPSSIPVFCAAFTFQLDLRAILGRHERVGRTAPPTDGMRVAMSVEMCGARFLCGRAATVGRPRW